jgi:hypothetical protein
MTKTKNPFQKMFEALAARVAFVTTLSYFYFKRAIVD